MLRKLFFKTNNINSYEIITFIYLCDITFLN